MGPPLVIPPEHIRLLADLIRWKRPRVVFEWGGGMSTVFLSTVFLSMGLDAKWYVAETSRYYASDIAARCGDNVEVLLFDYGWQSCLGQYHQQFLGNICAREYVEAIHLLEEPADLVLVDGRHRSRCIAEARKVMKKDGLIVLHDADRLHYRKACEGLDITIHRIEEEGEDASELWVMGRDEDVQCVP